ncbi:hypothetical protein LP7551_03893 [Roseibium album]|nr:hypothetical protein LP7551_03893 [Roseibium album]
MKILIVSMLAVGLAACQTIPLTGPYIAGKGRDYVRVEGVVHNQNEDVALSLAQEHCQTLGKSAVFAFYSRTTASSTYWCHLPPDAGGPSTHT